jgi:hypothetical protein
MSDLEARVQRLEDIDHIRQLRASYCLYLDTGKYDEVSELFTENAEFTGMGLPRGRQEIHDFFVGLQDSIAGFWHFTTNETIEVDGDKGTGEAYLYLTCVMDGVAYVGAGRYEDEFAREDGTWKLHKRVVTFFYFVPNSEGWLSGKIVPESARKAVDASVTLI